MPPKLDARQLFWGGLALLGVSLLTVFVTDRMARSNSVGAHTILLSWSPYLGYVHTVLQFLGAVALAGSFVVRAAQDERRVRSNRSPLKGDDQVWP